MGNTTLNNDWKKVYNIYFFQSLFPIIIKGKYVNNTIKSIIYIFLCVNLSFFIILGIIIGVSIAAIVLLAIWLLLIVLFFVRKRKGAFSRYLYLDNVCVCLRLYFNMILFLSTLGNHYRQYGNSIFFDSVCC